MFAAEIFDANQLGTIIAVGVFVIIALANLKSLFSKSTDELPVTRKEFDALQTRANADHERLADTVKRQELNDSIRGVTEQNAKIHEQMADLRVRLEELYRSTNKDVQTMIVQMFDRMERNQKHLLRMVHPADVGDEP